MPQLGFQVPTDRGMSVAAFVTADLADGPLISQRYSFSDVISHKQPRRVAMD